MSKATNYPSCSLHDLVSFVPASFALQTRHSDSSTNDNRFRHRLYLRHNFWTSTSTSATLGRELYPFRLTTHLYHDTRNVLSTLDLYNDNSTICLAFSPIPWRPPLPAVPDAPVPSPSSLPVASRSRFSFSKQRGTESRLSLYYSRPWWQGRRLGQDYYWTGGA